MKIVSVGDMFITTAMMESAVRQFERYTNANYFMFGPQNRGEARAYIKKMETHGFNCEPLPQEILEELEDANALHVHLAPIPAKVFETAKNLKIILSNRGGTENIDLRSAEEKGVAVLCNPAHNAGAVAEMTVGLIIAETRNIARNHASLTRDGVWYETPPNAGRIHELSSMTVGLVGFGTIGRLVAGLLTGFHSTILVFDPYAAREDIVSCGAQIVDTLDELLGRSDVVSLHARVNKETTGMIGEGQLRKMRENAVLINTARPALVDMGALYIALKERWITGAAIDVYPIEPLPADYPLLTLDNVTLTCHKGGDTVESYASSPQMVLNEAEAYFNGKTPRFWANPGVGLWGK